MKKATFTYTGNPTGRREEVMRGCIVTLKNDGKISVNLPGFDRHRHSYAAKFHAQKLAKEIVAANFEHAAVDQLKTDDTSLVAILTEKTQELKIAYIDHTKGYAAKEFKAMLEALEKPMEWWLDRFEVKWEWKTYGSSNEKHAVPVSGEYGKAAYYSMQNKMQGYRKIMERGYAPIEAYEDKQAELHYADSISKLSDRLIKKGVSTANMEIVVARVGINIEITIDCNGVITRAWTIGAEGPVQRYHFRYLVK